MHIKYLKHFTTNVLWLLPCILSHLLLPCKDCYAANTTTTEGLPLYYWHENKEINFGDYLSVKLLERIVGGPITTYEKKPVVLGKKLLALGSILYFAREDDVVWGSGVSGIRLNKKDYSFRFLDIRAVRGPLTKKFLKENFDLDTPEIYGDPALLMPYFFPELKRKENPKYDYIVIPHYREEKMFPKADNEHIVYPTDYWEEVVDKILDSEFVISSALHGIVVAEAFGIPARMLRVSEKEPFLKYQDYYLGTNRPNFKFATSIEEALLMGGEEPFECDLKKLYDAFPFDLWPNTTFSSPAFPIPRSHAANQTTDLD